MTPSPDPRVLHEGERILGVSPSATRSELSLRSVSSLRAGACDMYVPERLVDSPDGNSGICELTSVGSVSRRGTELIEQEVAELTEIPLESS